MIKRAASRQQGFSLFELIISLTIFLLILLAVYHLFDTGTATYRSGQGKADVQQNARAALDEMVRQLRMAGYFPENFDTDLTNNLVTPRAIHVAMSTGLAVYGDLDGSNASKIFLYCVQMDKPTRKVFIRRRTGQAGVDASYPSTCTSGDILAELADLTYQRDSDTIIDNTAWLTITYYDANNALIQVPAVAPKGLDGEVFLGAVPSFASTTNRGNVRTVVISLVLREDMAHQNPQIYSLTSSIRLRNIN